jgi:hypothetical protein
MYFKIEKSGCCHDRGLCQIRYDLYHEPGESGYEEHHVQVPVIPDGTIIPTFDSSETEKVWFNQFPKQWQDNPFCCHFIQAQPTITDEEILYVGELALNMSHENFVSGHLEWNTNQLVKFNIHSPEHCENRISKIKGTDFTTVPIKSKVPYKVK